MPAWFTDEVVAALIAAVVGIITVATSARVARREADARTRELAASVERLVAEQETVRQEQLTEILKKRIETYPALWEIISVYGRNWEIEGKPWDHRWAQAFLKALIDNNARARCVLFEQGVRVVRAASIVSRTDVNRAGDGTYGNARRDRAPLRHHSGTDAAVG